MSPSKASQTPASSRFFLWLGLAFVLRLAFGLCSDIVFIDQRQIYILGLKFYCTGAWPFFGPDVTLNMQIPGALQALTVGLPLRLLPIPESPYIFLNLLSFTSLCLLAWYFSKRLPKFPKWVLWTWVMTCPWMLNCSTNIFNVSYVLFGAVLFFIGFMETIPALSLGLVTPWLCNAMMGFALLWNAQFHLSTVILAPYVAVSFFFQLKSKGLQKTLLGALAFLAGACLSGAFLFPTYVQYGLQIGAGGTQNALAFNRANFLAFFTILARYFSLASCEVPRFIGSHTDERLKFLDQYLWAAPFIAIAGILGIIQPIVMLVSGFKKKHPQKDWKAVKILGWGTFALIYVSFLFAFKAPAAHTYFVTIPVVLLYAFYVFQPWVSHKWFKYVAGLLLFCNLVFALAVAVDNFKVRSLYQERATFTKAIEEKNYSLVGERRAGTLY